MATENRPYGKTEPYDFEKANKWLKEANVTDVEITTLASGATLMRRVGEVTVIKIKPRYQKKPRL